MKKFFVFLITVLFSSSVLAAWCCNWSLRDRKKGETISGQTCTGGNESNKALYKRAWKECGDLRRKRGLNTKNGPCNVTANKCYTEDGASLCDFWGNCKKKSKKGPKKTKTRTGKQKKQPKPR